MHVRKLISNQDSLRGCSFQFQPSFALIRFQIKRNFEETHSVSFDFFGFNIFACGSRRNLSSYQPKLGQVIGMVLALAVLVLALVEVGGLGSGAGF